MLVELRTTGSELAPFCTKARAGVVVMVLVLARQDGSIVLVLIFCVSGRSTSRIDGENIQLRATAFPVPGCCSARKTPSGTSTRALATLSPMRARVFDLWGGGGGSHSSWTISCVHYFACEDTAREMGVAGSDNEMGY